MKTRFTLILALIAFCLVPQMTKAQKVELTPLYGYQLGAKLNYPGGFLRLDDGDQYGIALTVNTINDIGIEFWWMRQDAEMTIRDNIFVPFETRVSDMAVDWFQIGGMRYLDLPNEKIRPFGGVSLGLAVFTPSNPNLDLVDRSLGSTTRFSFAINGGVKIMMSERIGLRLQGQLLVPVEWGGIYIGIGSGGPSTGASLGSTILMGAFSGGIVIGLGGASGD